MIYLCIAEYSVLDKWNIKPYMAVCKWVHGWGCSETEKFLPPINMLVKLEERSVETWKHFTDKFVTTWSRWWQWVWSCAGFTHARWWSYFEETRQLKVFQILSALNSSTCGIQRVYFRGGGWHTGAQLCPHCHNLLHHCDPCTLYTTHFFFWGFTF